MKRETITLMLNGVEDGFISETAVFRPASRQESPERTAHMKKKRIITAALAAALMLVLGISAFAIWGIPRFTGTHPMPKTAEYTSLSALPEIEKDVGYPVTVPEHFSNGYAFSMLRVDGKAVFGESYEVLKEYYSVHVTYTRDGKPDLSLSLSPVSEFESISEAPVRTVSSVTVDLNCDHYKVVPEDYEKTEDDLAQEAAGHYYISFGSDQIEEREVASAEFKLDNVSYTLMDMAAKETSLDTLAQMAGEIIEEAKA